MIIYFAQGFKHHRLNPLFLLLSLGLIWGSGYSIARYAMTHGVPPLGYAFWQSLGPAILLIILQKTKCVNLKSIPYYLICGLLGIAIPNTVMYFASPHLPASLVAIIVNTVPIFTYPIAMLYREKFSILKLAGVIVGFAGIGFILIPHVVLPSWTQFPWAIFTLLTPLSFALCANFINFSQKAHSNPMVLSAGMLVASTVLLSPLVLLTHSFYTLSSWTLPNAAVGLEVLLSTLGYVLFFKLIQQAGSVYYSLVGGIVSLTGILWGKILFHESLSFFLPIALVFIFLGIFLVSKTLNDS